MISLTKAQTNELLKLIKNPEERKTVKTYLRELEKNVPGAAKGKQNNLRTSRLAKGALNILSRVGIELLKHEAYGKFLDLFD
jgi:hypothetical protein